MTNRTTHIKDHSQLLCLSPTYLFSCLSTFFQKALFIGNWPLLILSNTFNRFLRDKQLYVFRYKFARCIKGLSDGCKQESTSFLPHGQQNVVVQG